MVVISGAGNPGGVLVHADLDQALQVRSCRARGWAIMCRTLAQRGGGQRLALGV